MGEPPVAIQKVIRGYGSGYGSVYGYGDGYGDGYGYGDFLYQFLMDQTNSLPDGKYAFWWSDSKGLPCNGGEKGNVAQPGLVEQTQGPLILCENGTLHATINPSKWKGDRLWLVEIIGDYIQDADKIGCLQRRIVKEIKRKI